MAGLVAPDPRSAEREKVSLATKYLGFLEGFDFRFLKATSTLGQLEGQGDCPSRPFVVECVRQDLQKYIDSDPCLEYTGGR